MKLKWVWIIWGIVATHIAIAQDIASYLDTKVATHQYHGDGAEVNDASKELASSVKHDPLTAFDWLNKHLPEIFSQDYINFTTHDQLVSTYFSDSGLADYEAWQKKHLTVLIRHQSIVKASLFKPLDDASNQTSLDEQSFSVPIKLMFYGYDRHLMKKVDVVNLTVDVVLKPDPANDWVISKLSVTVDDNRKENQIPA